MLSLFDFIYLVPIYLAFLSSCRESRVSLALKMESKTSKEDMMEEKNTTLRQFISGCVSASSGVGTTYADWLARRTLDLQWDERSCISFPWAFYETPDDVVASFPCGGADSSVTAIEHGVLLCCNETDYGGFCYSLLCLDFYWNGDRGHGDLLNVAHLESPYVYSYAWWSDGCTKLFLDRSRSYHEVIIDMGR